MEKGGGCIVLGVSTKFLGFWSQLSTKKIFLLDYSMVVASPSSQVTPGHFTNFILIG